MRFASVSSRLSLVTAIDLEQASGGRFGTSFQGAYEQWDDLLEFSATVTDEGTPLSDIPGKEFGNPAPRPRQEFAIGLNYANHAAESSFVIGEEQPALTKFQTSQTSPYGTIALPPGQVDWEVELVVVIGRPTHRVAPRTHGAT
ncbi:fumarylacetoacetate hydrolase family protein [Streptomyces sp. NPDC047081]|uniref:fumarylacetoacetate hydrolase family protein n=1 Tax=Streptomyces sp. NPDC047081 TaxID=3154706 RepID=UPI0033CD57DB